MSYLFPESVVDETFDSSQIQVQGNLRSRENETIRHVRQKEQQRNTGFSEHSSEAMGQRTDTLLKRQLHQLQSVSRKGRKQPYNARILRAVILRLKLLAISDQFHQDQF